MECHYQTYSLLYKVLPLLFTSLEEGFTPTTLNAYRLSRIVKSGALCHRSLTISVF